MQSNIITLKQGGIISGVDLKPLSSALDLWNIVNGNWNLYKTSVTQIMLYHRANATTSLALKATTKEIDEQFRKKQFESMASDLIASSDRLVNQLALQTDKNSNDLILLQILFAVLIVSILILILYLVARMLKPILDLTQATSKINRGNFDVTVRQRGRDELSTLTQSFNSMTASIRASICPS
ncbi:MAG: HAMP domain-containing protein [Candidatus Nitrosopolaris sp.]